MSAYAGKDQVVAEETYNGWKNYETWCVKLHLSNDEGDYRYWREVAAEKKSVAGTHKNVLSGIWTEVEAAKFSLADVLKEELEGRAPQAGGMWADLLNSALSEVDWNSIAEAFLED